ncbi:nuclear transport factor 2 family protein [Collimonas pratensis]|uniref:nuclear transport factor 2 family protein n=1 Tax=Collimonas pratensis TaxID=279113 RepID=UPI00143CE9B1|nr:nuclear transport factor 2 family protein [Collimonas pratensis]NKI68304.1 nuclear transport factor 2 family protein [Collimonas pratensis]
MHTELEKTWEKYTSAWKMTSKAERLATFSEALADHAVYTDPLVRATSWDELISYMENLHQQIPGAHFVTTHFMSHHQKSIANWEMKTPENVTIGTGISYGEYDDRGRLISMNGFFKIDS